MQAIEYLPIPFEPYGRSFKGVDCWGLVCLIYDRELNIKLPLYDTVHWEDGPNVAASVEHEALWNWREVPPEERKPFDVVLLRIKGLPWHVGVLLTPTTFIHAHPGIGVCIERLESLHWKSRILGYHRLK